MFKIIPSAIRATSIMQASSLGMMSGTGTDSGLIAWYSETLFKWILIDSNSQEFPFDCVISVNGDTLIPYGVAVHGNPAWMGSTYCLYREPSASYEWVIMPRLKLGYYIPATDATYDCWRYYGSAPQTATLAKQGTATADVTANIDSWARWESATQFGVYSAAGGATGTKTIGLPMWKDGDGKEYIRSLEALGTPEHYTYGVAYYDSENELWIIGIYGAADGWHQCADEPSTTTAKTFSFSFLDDETTEPTGDDITLTFDSYVAGENSNNTYVGEVAIWRT